MTNPTPNAKPKILGSDEHFAELTGNGGVDTHDANLDGDCDNSQENIDFGPQTFLGVTQFNQFPRHISFISETQILTDTMSIPVATATEEYGYLVCAALCLSGKSSLSNSTIKLLVDEVQVASRVITLPDAGGTGSRNYNAYLITKYQPKTILSGSITIRVRLSATTVVAGGAITSTIIKLTNTQVAELIGDPPIDSHGVTLSGENEQRTHETGILQ